MIRSRFGRTLLLLAGLVSWASAGPTAQSFQPVSPFDIVGFVDSATVNAKADGFSGGGTITVNGTVITVPEHTLLQMPAFALTWQEVFTMAPAPWGPTQSGLARHDTPRPETTYEVRIQGNRVGDEYIAGLMFIAQQSLNNGAGFINYIDYTAGELRVGGVIGDPATGARVRINDPAGKFGRAWSNDPRFTIDEDNPTVRSETAYPMCVPRKDPAAGVDPLCPQKNRPKGADGNYLTIFTTDVPPGWEFLTPPGYVPNGTNALVMAPFEVGDYVDYNGNLATDGNGPYVAAWSVIANAGIFTQPGTQPTYVSIDVSLLGVGGVQDPNLPQEAAVRTVMEGFTTDPSSFVMLMAVDVDPCTGAESERWYDMVGVDPGAPTGAVAGRWRWRPSDDMPFLPPTRNLRALSINGAYMNWDTGDTRTPAGLAAGIYTAPTLEFIFPENLGIGNPPVPSNFQDFPFLANGSGAYFGAVAGESSLGRLGQLKPWPGAVAPVAPTCGSGGAIFTPIADAGPARTVKQGDVVTLDGAGSRDTTTPTKMPLTFTWSQVDAAMNPVINPAAKIALADATVPFGTPQETPQLTFRVDKFENGQNIPENTVLTFTLEVTNCSVWSDPGTCGTSFATTTVTVVKNPTPTDTLSGITAVWRVKRSRLDVTATTSDPAAVLTVLGFGDMGPALPIATGVPAPAGDRSYTQVGVNPKPDQITVRSSLGAIVTVPVTVR